MGTAIASVLTRLEHVENLLADGYDARTVSRKVRKEWGITRRQADRYVRAAFDRWHEESQANREDKRSQVRAMLRGAYRRAMNKTRTYQNSEGEVLEYDDPDIRGATNCIELIMRLEGLIEPEVKVVGVAVPERLITVLQQHYGMEPAKLDPGETVVEAEGDSDGGV